MSYIIDDVSSVVAKFISTGLKNYDKLSSTTTKTLNVDLGVPISEDGPFLDENGLELNFNGACPYLHVRKDKDGAYIPIFYCPVNHPDRQDVETAKELSQTSTTSNMFTRGTKFEDPRDAAWVANEISKEPLVNWLEYFEYRIWEAPTPPKWKGSPIPDDMSKEDFISLSRRTLDIIITFNK